MWDDSVKGKTPLKDRAQAAWNLWWHVPAPVLEKARAVWTLMDAGRHPWQIHVTAPAVDNVQSCRRCGEILLQPGVLSVMNAEPETAYAAITSDGVRWVWKAGIMVARQGPLLYALPESRIKGVYFEDEIPCKANR